MTKAARTKPSSSARRNGAPPVKVRASPVHGRGVYSTRPIRKGARIMEYTGQRMAWEDAPNDPESAHTFNFGLHNGMVINPDVGGNDARWINHSCDPNCEAIEDENDRIYIYARRRIEAGEELFYDYKLEIDEPRTPAVEKEYACRCGSERCRGYLLKPARKPRRRKSAGPARSKRR